MGGTNIFTNIGEVMASTIFAISIFGLEFDDF